MSLRSLRAPLLNANQLHSLRNTLPPQCHACLRPSRFVSTYARLQNVGTGHSAASNSTSEPWKSQKKALKEKFGNEGWQPRKRLSPDALEGIRHLHSQDPVQYSTPYLAERFEVSPEVIRRILKSKWQPSENEQADRRQRWEKRGQAVWDRWAELGMKAPRKWREQNRKASPGDSIVMKPDAKPARSEAHRRPKSQSNTDVPLSSRIL